MWIMNIVRPIKMVSTGFAKRLYQLAIKLSSVKGAFALICTKIFVDNPTSPQAFSAFVLSWVIFIGAREAAKFKGIIPTFGRDGQGQ